MGQGEEGGYSFFLACRGSSFLMVVVVYLLCRFTMYLVVAVLASILLQSSIQLLL
jgi:hypothetical protein